MYLYFKRQNTLENPDLHVLRQPGHIDIDHVTGSLSILIRIDFAFTGDVLAARKYPFWDLYTFYVGCIARYETLL